MRQAHQSPSCLPEDDSRSADSPLHAQPGRWTLPRTAIRLLGSTTRGITRGEGTRHTGRPDEVRALDAFIKLMRATDSISANLAAHVAEAGVTLGQFGVLEALLHLGPMSQCDLGGKLLRSSRQRGAR